MWKLTSVPPPEAARDDYSGALRKLLSAYGDKFPDAGRFNHKNAGLGGCEKPKRARMSATEWSHCPGRVPLGIPGAIQENYRVMLTPKDPQKAEKKEVGCAHPYILQWLGKCEGCRITPLSPSLPDPYNPNKRPQNREDAA